MRLEIGGEKGTLDQELQKYLKQMVELRSGIWKEMSMKNHGFAYSCIEEWFLKHGRAMGIGQLDARQKMYLRRVGKHVGFEIKQCYRNTQEAVIFDARGGKSLLQYCEGYAYPERLIPVEHAWMLIDGAVWDPTFEILNPNRGTAYFGKEFSEEEVAKHMRQTDEYGPLVNDWQRGYPLLKGEGG